MPHIRLRCTRPVAEAIDLSAFAAALHAMLAETAPPVAVANCKTLLTVADGAHVADGGASWEMAHLDIALLAGRDRAVKDAARDKALALLVGLSGKRVQTSVRLVEMPVEDYKKTIVDPP